MNNLLSYCGLIDAKIRASDKDLPVQAAISEVFSTDEDPLDAAEFSAIDYINEMFPTEQSLTNLDDTITEMRGNISGIDDDLRHIVRGHRAVATSESDLQSGPGTFCFVFTLGSIHILMTSDVFWTFLTYLPTYPNQILYYISLFSKIRFSLTYLPKYLTSYVNAP